MGYALPSGVDRVRSDASWSVEALDQFESQLQAANSSFTAARSSAAERAVADLNTRYAFIAAVGSKTAVLDTAAEDADGRLISKDTLFERTANRFVSVKAGVDKKGNPVFQDKPTGRVWFSHPNRREYSRFIFAPGETHTGTAYNLWKGWAVTARPGGTFETLRDQILHNICLGNEDHARWIWDSIAAIFQRPQEKVGKAVALLGEQGVGKSKLGEIIGFLLGEHYVATAEADYVLGTFNAACENKLLLQMEEAVWAGDHKRQGKLKDLITAARQMIRRLYVDAYNAHNHMRFIFTSNEEWAVPVEKGDRRFAVSMSPSLGRKIPIISSR